VKEIKIMRVACPLHILQLRMGLREIDENEVLQVEIGQIAVKNDLVSACRSLGHPVEVVIQNNAVFLYVKKSPSNENILVTA